MLSVANLTLRINNNFTSACHSFHPAVKEVADAYPHTYVEKFRGTTGPINVTVPIHAHTIDKIVQDTLVNKGIKRIDDPYGGDVSGFIVWRVSRFLSWASPSDHWDLDCFEQC